MAEPDAPTAVEANPGMDTILTPDPMTGVQDNESEEYTSLYGNERRDAN